MSTNSPKTGRINRAVLWQLQLCLRLLDGLGYRVAAAYVATAIDALTNEALPDGQISEMDLADKERARLVLELFEKHGSMKGDETDSKGRGSAGDAGNQ